ncbi:MarR family transcriptional regulator for hemolysin [Breznakibacter xylanolyticus]|uniref:MarR family transcriptional regulator for hemolysin n=1 Tax=Breznakibacter xylanolyticus TaxID=990 RepID=A0A2W7PAC9_9BACT|nr:MarR family transcriptional regulator [Breznakibacter xylanolyticus]PZX20302.1 MarR family transcriptional regulator for hemolysin [Breznakibacter xylanolyticus]
MATIIKPLGLSLGPMLSAITRPMKAILKQEEIPYSIEHLVLLKITRDCKDSVVQQDLAEKMGKDKSVILRIVDILEKDGLLRRIVNPNDRRRNILEVTYLGNQFINRFQEIEMQVSKELLKNLTDEEVEHFFRIVEKIKTNAENM